MEPPAREVSPSPVRSPDDRRHRAEPQSAPYCIRARDNRAGRVCQPQKTIHSGNVDGRDANPKPTIAHRLQRKKSRNTIATQTSHQTVTTLRCTRAIARLANTVALVT